MEPEIWSAEKTRLAEGKRLFLIFRRLAKPKEIKTDLTLNEFMLISEEPCYYCKSPPYMRAKRPVYTGKKIGLPNPEYGFIHNSLTKIVVNKGMVKGNIRTCCKKCSLMKLDMDEKDFLLWVQKVYEYQHRFDD